MAFQRHRRGDRSKHRLRCTTRRNGEALQLKWSETIEIKATRKRILSAYNNLLLRDYDPATREIPGWLPGEYHARWAEVVEMGCRLASASTAAVSTCAAGRDGSSHLAVGRYASNVLQMQHGGGLGAHPPAEFGVVDQRFAVRQDHLLQLGAPAI